MVLRRDKKSSTLRFVKIVALTLGALTTMKTNTRISFSPAEKVRSHLIKLSNLHYPMFTAH